MGVSSFAQQDAQFTEYMYNMSLINPAYATDDPDVINLGSMYRAQWVGSVGGPKTISFFGHTPITNRVEGGLSLVHDDIGDVVKETNIFADIAYVIPISATTKLSLGIKAGATFYNTNFDGFVFSDPLPDPAFAENVSEVFPNVGVGAFIFGENYYFGLSAPNLLKAKHLNDDDGLVALGKEEIHYYVTGGYVFKISDNLKLKPAFLTKAVSGSPLSLDITTNVLIHDKFEIGVGYRLGDAISGLFNFRVTPDLRIGYAYDYTLSNLGKFNNGSHEIMLLYDLNLIGIKTDKSPRFF